MRLSDWSSDVCSSDLIYRQAKIVHYADGLGAWRDRRSDAGDVNIASPGFAIDKDRRCAGNLHGMGGGKVGLRWNDHLVARPNAKVDICEMQRSEEHTSELQSLMRISYAVF